MRADADYPKRVGERQRPLELYEKWSDDEDNILVDRIQLHVKASKLGFYYPRIASLIESDGRPREANHYDLLDYSDQENN
ncbi:hypothetical protein NPIL_420401 [Nephila pilipes]|uniref:Uncharacterized protein n=1 Tax=Nephila pilipes TaxID=299642 RepID=A0A8X6MHF5_NEPPI|nr:hypothetical protein NPIL_420401 [Nephila pilipes]